jgi:hypothetical protein
VQAAAVLAGMAEMTARRLEGPWALQHEGARHLMRPLRAYASAFMLLDASQRAWKILHLNKAAAAATGVCIQRLACTLLPLLLFVCCSAGHRSSPSRPLLQCKLALTGCHPLQEPNKPEGGLAGMAHHLYLRNCDYAFTMGCGARFQAYPCTWWTPAHSGLCSAAATRRLMSSRGDPFK